MTTETQTLTDEQIVGILHNTPLAARPSHHVVFARAIEQAVLQSPEVRRLRNIEKAAFSVLSYTQAKHRPPVREAIPCGETAAVRVHALADLHDALHPESPVKTAAMEQQK